GLFSDKITSVAGSSEYFKGAAIVYSNELKMKLLGVRKETLARFGAVSAECAVEMAEGARERLNTDCAVSITGIAGPGGGSKEKPVGLAYIAVAVKGRPTASKRCMSSGSRDTIKNYSAANALALLRIHLES
ncbi:MAG TPA: nicotinamide-nucleotide amidohydrolase family protein, partial [Elusimicrobiales bacterium]|nr:nicotinamide-nucleotide amidohydrolase family protein [Elusimicrobiales bacterium]